MSFAQSTDLQTGPTPKRCPGEKRKQTQGIPRGESFYQRWMRNGQPWREAKLLAKAIRIYVKTSELPSRQSAAKANVIRHVTW